MPKQRERCLNAVQKSKNDCGGNYLSVTVISNMKCHEKCVLLLLLLFGQVDQQDVSITGPPSKRQSKKKETKRSNHQTVIKNQQNYSNPYQATKLRPARDWEILNCIKLTQHYKTH
jgi:hypothetical protein